jgi:hypothetical protein
LVSYILFVMQNVEERSEISKIVIVASVVAVVLVAGLGVFYVSSGSSPSAGANITCGSNAPSGELCQCARLQPRQNYSNDRN